MDYVCPTMEQQRLPAPNDPYFFAETRQPYLAGPAQTVQDLHPRYRAVQEMVPHDRVIGLEGQYHWPPLERGGDIVPQQDNIVGYYNSHAVPVNRYGPPLAQLHAPASRRTGFAGGSASVSSFYSFAGATQKHR
ncbi:hypothetical protein F0562_024463 [Nyssa sinensis]|uniref:Uncharacterized protein n=1 Tax=Nyssa sinensis TaxID=561372 RepID=A0A5J5BD83_9ASTE|nr:hypothetical protein F0562_024463 [Nyssa sinensis]